MTPEYVAKLPEPAQKQYVGEELYARVLAGTKQPEVGARPEASWYGDIESKTYPRTSQNEAG